MTVLVDLLQMDLVLNPALVLAPMKVLVLIPEPVLVELVLAELVLAGLVLVVLAEYLFCMPDTASCLDAPKPTSSTLCHYYRNMARDLQRKLGQVCLQPHLHVRCIHNPDLSLMPEHVRKNLSLMPKHVRKNLSPMPKHVRNWSPMPKFQHYFHRSNKWLKR